MCKCWLGLFAFRYGAIRCDGRQFLGNLISRAAKLNPLLDKAQLATTVWQAVSTAAISRAAQQLAAVSEMDAPLGLDLRLLDRIPPTAPTGDLHLESEATDVDDEDMGNIPLPLPSPRRPASVPPPMPPMEIDEVVARPAAGDPVVFGAPCTEPTLGIRVMVRSPNGCPVLPTLT